MKVKQIKIKPLGESLKDFAAVYKRASHGKSAKKKGDVFFASMDAVRKVLTTTRVNLMRIMKKNHPSSLYELAKLAHRDLKNVSQDVAFLEELGLVDLQKPAGSRNQRRPVLLTDRFSLEFAI